MAEPSNRQKDIFLQALEIASEEARARFITDACGDDAALRNQVEGMLRAHARADSFLEKPAATLEPTLEIPSPGRHLEEAPGAEIGPYKLLQPIGEGGMGVVWMAEQSEPIRRKVALKIIKPGLASPQVIARFEAERQALAMMDHPNIARVLDAGTTESGRPFFVMELVKGTTITEYCDLNRLTQRERLELFVPVCQAIQHAHQKGIIHRDIKPSNVLVTMYDGTPVAKVIDFGIAKAIREPLTDKTLFTLHGQIIGTFEYMSPEQASLNALDVDTRSDIYALGVLLYELLTGKTPLDKERLRQAAFGEILRLIREEDPARPSNRLRDSGDELAQLALYRKSDSVKLPEQVRGDLDWIAMKALDKDRTRRYETASAFAADVQHFLNDEAIDARPPSTAYRLGKFIKRNRAPVLAASLLLVTLFTGITGTVWGWVEALAQRDLAVQASKDEEQQRQIAVASAAQAKRAEDEARRAEDEARRLAKAEIEARRKAEESENKAEWRLYASNIAHVQRELDAHNTQLAGHYLKQCRLDFRGWEHVYLASRVDPSVRTLSVPKGGVYSVAFSPDGKQIAAPSSFDKKVIIWNAANGQELFALDGHETEISGIGYSSDSKRLVSADRIGKVIIWDAVIGKRLQTVNIGGTPHSVAFSPDGSQLFCASNKSVILWDLASEKVVRTFQGHMTTILGMAMSRDGKRIATATSSNEKVVKVWDVNTGMELLEIQGAGSRVAFSPDGKWLAGTSQTQMVKVWDAARGQERVTLRGHTKAIYALAFSPDGTRIATGSMDKTVKLWDAATGQEIRTLIGHTLMAGDVAFSPDGKYLASAGQEGTVKLWLATGERGLLKIKTGYTLDGLNGFAFSPDGKRVAATARQPVGGAGGGTWASIGKDLRYCHRSGSVEAG